jgi:hypothetical protein
MDKIAQSKRQTGRGLFNKLRDLSNIPGEKLSGFFKPEHERVMKSLRELDDRIRAEITGTEIEGISPATGINMSLKDLIKDARKNFSRNEFMSGVSDLAAVHQKMSEVVKEINKFYIDVNKIHHKFLFEGTNDEKLNRMRSHMERKANLELAAMMIKEAGIMDFLHNIATPRGRALSAWVKKYPKETKELREQGLRLVDSAQSLYETTLGVLKEMASARATRRPDEYMDQANKIKNEFAKFDSGNKGFTAYYNNVVMPFIKIKDEMDQKQKQEEKENPAVEMAPPPGGRTELGGTPKVEEEAAPFPLVTQKQVAPSVVPELNTPAPRPPVVPELNIPAPKAPVSQPQTSIQFNQPPGASPPFAPAPQQPTLEEPAPDTERSPTLRGVGSHQRFMESLEAMSGEDPRILAGYISKYAKSIQGTDPTAAISLFALVRKIKG